MADRSQTRDWREIVGETSRVTDRVKRKELLNELEHTLEKRYKILGIAHEVTAMKVRMAVTAEASAAIGAARNECVDFLKIDLEVGLSFGLIALESPDKRKRKHLATRARDAYETVSRFRERVSLSDAEAAHIDSKLDELKKVLQQLGQ